MIVRFRRPRKSILIRPEALGGRVVELRDDLAVLEAAHDRDDVDDGVRGHDDAGGVHAPLPLQAFNAQGGLKDLRAASGSVRSAAGNRRPPVALGFGVLDVGQRECLRHHGRRQRLGHVSPMLNG